MAPVDNPAERPLGWASNWTITASRAGSPTGAPHHVPSYRFAHQRAGGAGCPQPRNRSRSVLSERFQREDDIDKALEHPGLIKLIEKHGRTSGSSHSYMVREWFDGISLRELLSKAKLPPERAIAITASICEIADYVHSHGVVLRDLEPDHILVGEKRSGSN